ncbi:TadE/TadG family type IV pilus assembly protein [Erythrobacter sp. GH1-10]|uniref:TadE/TadG family type IV pilus assembly protein n=1 Tax=Erythrobacter sp. GH1-10 TaxID=3349334 RepID=UPI003877D34B
MRSGLPFQFLRDESGAVAATYALALFGLLAVAGVGFDYARMAGMDSELQNGADQAALAGATQLDGASGACSRAANAAVSLVANQTLLASGANAVTIPLETGCDATGQIRFWQDKDKASAATNDSNANYIEIFVNARSVDYALLPITGLIRSDDIRGVALAGLGSAICKVPPVMLCNPNEPSFNVNDYIGKGLRLVANDGGGFVPGNFGYLETNAGSGANATAATLGRVTFPGDCVSTAQVTTKPGVQVSVLDALNTRMDVYAQGINNPCPNGATCPASAIARKDLVKGPGNSCGVTGNGWQVGPNPYRPTSASPLDNAQADLLDPMGYPRDICHAVSNTGACIGGQVGDGVWDRNAYFRSNSHIYPGGAPLSLGANPTRYDVYKYEAANNLTAEATVGANLRAPGGPICGPQPGVPVNAGVADRRVLSVAVLNCGGNSGKFDSTPIEFVDVFLVEPSIDRGNGPSKVTEKSDVYVEVIGRTTLGGGATSGQEIRKDVPYLVE